MGAKKFLKEELNKLFSLIEGITIRYEYSEILKTHIVEILPVEIFKENKEYIDWEIEVDDRFSEYFDGEELMFISDDSLTKIETPEMVLKREECTQQELIEQILTDPLSNNTALEIFPCELKKTNPAMNISFNENYNIFHVCKRNVFKEMFNIDQTEKHNYALAS